MGVAFVLGGVAWNASIGEDVANDTTDNTVEVKAEKTCDGTCCGSEDALNVNAGTIQTTNAGILPQAGGNAGTINGTVSLNGKVRKKAIDMGSDEACKGSGQMFSEATVVNGDGRVKWCFVYIKDEDGELAVDEAPDAPVVLDQKGCVYSPHVFGIVAGQTLQVTNSDKTTHNLHSYADLNDNFNKPQESGADALEFSFDLAEEAISIKCDYHSWMQTFCHVMDHPYFAVTNDAGKFTITGLPAGEYTLVVWHEEFQNQEVKVTVGDAPATVDVTLEK
jgi:plastocyanin